eukprot:CAMPEP_0197321600 /NCGR_PEP_ID=MMETSP0891-20130614/65452_1 /TAXON_ID=44058 ORGANISM="Aureoumbra lagunensis, Strain CCMP1510" /NCGR_SAMPLE_ID=MMETSP0891 /ASSEMBLY_ACC=CAM_ASM_000534 /LENGTH=350 /DNA_ID=CAMNT_0042813557 /DNA_START=104 /DNA_END=1157 /DNA_ORIENTATION=+
MKRMIDLRTGHPNGKHHPLLSSACEKLARAGGNELNYNPPIDERFNNWLAAFIQTRSSAAEEESHKIDTSRFIATNGVSHGLDLAMRTLVGRRRVVCTESPTYFLAFSIFADHDSEIVTVPVDENGLCIDELEHGLRDGRKIDALYLIPRHGNPSGTTLSAERRKKLAALSREYDFWILADETYDLLDWTPHKCRPKRLAYYFDRPTDKFVGLNSFSKILAAPGLRLGWIEAPLSVLDKLIQNGVVRSGGGYAPFLSSLITQFDVHTHLDALICEYRNNVNAIIQELQEHDPKGELLSVTSTPTGGYFMWLRLPPGMHPDSLLDAAKHDVTFLPDIVVILLENLLLFQNQ